MYTKNVLGIEDSSIKIYRIYQKKWLRQTFNNKSITLVQIEILDDPYENILMKCTLRLKGLGDISLKSIYKCIYVQ